MTPLPPAIAETHVSWVFFVGNRAFKLKKPVRYGFLDFTSRAAREAACHREVELNRRLAPDVYLGVLDVVDEGEVRDHLVEMRRMPPQRRLSTLVVGGESLDGEITQVAELLARFHAVAPVVEGPEMGELWERSFREVQPFAGAPLSADDAGAVEALARRYVAGRSALFVARQRDGFVRDGHGDLLADDIFLLEDGPRILDCIEFDDSLRYADVLADVAFLAMDLERLGAPSLSELLVERWSTDVEAAYPRSLLHHYIAYRAYIRCKVACLRHAQGDDEAAGAARLHLELARLHLEAGAVKLILVGGAPGTGKSTLASALAPKLDAVVVRTDEVRRDLSDPPEGRYSPGAKSRVYAKLVERAEHHLSLGSSVILDATWAFSGDRTLARDVAAATRSDLVELSCQVEVATATERVQARAETHGSEASTAVAAALAASADPWPEARTVSTAQTVEDSVSAALALIAGR